MTGRQWMRLKHTADTATKSMHDDDLGKSLLQLFRSQRSGIVHFDFASIGVVGAVLAVTVTLGLCLLRSRQYLGSSGAHAAGSISSVLRTVSWDMYKCSASVCAVHMVCTCRKGRAVPFKLVYTAVRHQYHKYHMNNMGQY
eukprot:3108-Heterococcus_DN1.PRE.3